MRAIVVTFDLSNSLCDVELPNYEIPILESSLCFDPEIV